MDQVSFAPLLLLSLLLWSPMSTVAKWQTLSGQPPVVVANGGTSGLYPDQTYPAYFDALANSLPGVVVTCELQMAQSLRSPLGTGICRTGLDLSISTDIMRTLPNFTNTYVIDGQKTSGWFAIDIPYENLTTVHATQSNTARTPVFDDFYPIVKPEFMPVYLNNTSGTWWLNSEYTHFIEENSNFNVTSVMLNMISSFSPGYVSATEVGLLKNIWPNASSSGTNVFYKFLDLDLIDPSVNQTYRSVLKNLTDIKTYATGILVPKSYILPIDPDSLYLLPPTSLVNDAHDAGLQVYAYNFANDQWPNSYNYSFDPITEILAFIEINNFSVDGIVTDFPTTASEAIGCYATSSRNGSTQNKGAIPRKQKVVSHNGDSGNYPGATMPAYSSAVQAGVDYIDCVVQITNDSVPFCRSSANLLDSTDAANAAFFQATVKIYPDFNGGKQGVYAFDLPWAAVSTLHSVIYSPDPGYQRDRGHDDQFGIITLAEFLAIAKNHSVGAFIDIQNAVYIRQMHNLAVVDAVANVLAASGYNSSDTVLLQSEDSSALARLRELNISYPLMYRIPAPPLVSLTATDFAEIKTYASSVNLAKNLVEPLDSNGFLLNTSDLVKMAHEQNLTAYFQLQRDEPIAFGFDLESDPTLEMHLLTQKYQIDGIVSDFPSTVINYLGNQCLGNGLTSSTLNFSIPLVIPGLVGSQVVFAPAPLSAPAPNLEVVEPPLSGLPAFAPVPAPQIPAAASRVSACLLLSAALSVVLHLVAAL